jgi:hypothetical protein
MLAFVSLPFFFESALHRGQVKTGLMMTPWPLAVGIGAPIAGRLTDKVSAAVLGAAGLLVLCAGLALLAGLPANPSWSEIAWRMALCGLGFGFFQAPNNRSMLSAAPLSRSGAAGGMLATARLTGQTIGGDSRRHLIPGCCTFRDRGTVGGRDDGRSRSGRRRGSTLSSRRHPTAESSDRGRHAVASRRGSFSDGAGTRRPLPYQRNT